MNTNSSSEKRISDLIHIAKCFSVFFIVSAHIVCGGIGVYPMAIVRRFSSIGVIVFLICSAYFFKPEKKNFVSFVKKKIKSIIIPWIVMGSFVYLINNIMSEVSLFGLIKWLLGYKTYLWYIPILICLFLLFYNFYSNTLFCAVCIIINVVSLFATSFNVIDPIISFLNLTNYLFLPNWIGVFAIGCLLRKYNVFEKLLKLKYRYVFMIIAAYVALLVKAAYVEPTASGYFSKFGLLLELLGAFIVFFVSSKIPCINILKTFSGYSYSVYLLHFVGIMVVNKISIFLTDKTEWITLFYFIPATLLVFVLLAIGYKIAYFIKINKLYALLTGVRIMAPSIKKEKK